MVKNPSGSREAIFRRSPPRVPFQGFRRVPRITPFELVAGHQQKKEHTSVCSFFVLCEDRTGLEGGAVLRRQNALIIAKILKKADNSKYWNSYTLLIGKQNSTSL